VFSRVDTDSISDFYLTLKVGFLARAWVTSTSDRTQGARRSGLLASPSSQVRMLVVVAVSRGAWMDAAAGAVSARVGV
jgi:hypothetical protein